MTPKITTQEPSGCSQKSLRLRLCHLRRIMGFSVREMAGEFGVTYTAIGLWENGKRSIPGPIVKLITLYEKELGIKAGSQNSKKLLKKIKTSWLTRGFKLSSDTASVFLRMSVETIQNLFSSSPTNSIQQNAYEAIARQMVATLGELKGFAFKIGQMVSYMNFAMPDSARTIFESLEYNSPPMMHAQVVDCFLQEFNKTPKQLFAEWCPLPFATASIGQVHRARLKSGEEVAVKVQYPGIQQVLQADLKGIKVLCFLLSILAPWMEKEVLYKELKDRLTEECDYLREAANQEEFRRLFSKDSQVYIPKVFPELTTPCILTMEFIEAQSFKQFRQSSTQDERNKAGGTIFKFAMKSLCKHHLFNCDPNPGNYLFKDGKVVFLDFGCVKRLNASSVEDWKEAVEALAKGDQQTFDAVCSKIEWIGDSKTFDFEYNRQLFRTIDQPWLARQPFQFTSDFFLKVWRALASENVNKFSMHVSRNWFLFMKRQWGIYSILTSLGAKNDFRKIMLHLIKK